MDVPLGCPRHLRNPHAAVRLLRYCQTECIEGGSVRRGRSSSLVIYSETTPREDPCSPPPSRTERLNPCPFAESVRTLFATELETRFPGDLLCGQAQTNEAPLIPRRRRRRPTPALVPNPCGVVQVPEQVQGDGEVPLPRRVQGRDNKARGRSDPWCQPFVEEGENTGRAPQAE